TCALPIYFGATIKTIGRENIAGSVDCESFAGNLYINAAAALFTCRGSGKEMLVHYQPVSYFLSRVFVGTVGVSAALRFGIQAAGNAVSQMIVRCRKVMNIHQHRPMMAGLGKTYMRYC